MVELVHHEPATRVEPYPARMQTVHHEEEGHYETQLVEEAWDEILVEEPARTVTREITPARDGIRVIRQAWDETLVTGERCALCGTEK